MGANVAATYLPIILRPDPARVVLRPFIPADDPPGADVLYPEIPSRAQRLGEGMPRIDRDTLR